MHFTNNDLEFERSEAPVYRRLVRHIRSMVVRGELEQGARVRETELVESFQQAGLIHSTASRKPVRQAISELVRLGLLTRRQRAGIEVRSPEKSEVRADLGLRIHVESGAACEFARKLAAGEVRSTRVDRLNRFHEELCDLADQTDQMATTRFVEVDMDVHLFIARVALGEYGAGIVEELFHRLLPISSRGVTSPAFRSAICLEHELLIDSLKDGDVLAVFDAVYYHLVSGVRRWFDGPNPDTDHYITSQLPDLLRLMGRAKLDYDEIRQGAESYRNTARRPEE